MGLETLFGVYGSARPYVFFAKHDRLAVANEMTMVGLKTLGWGEDKEVIFGCMVRPERRFLLFLLTTRDNLCCQRER